VTGLFNTRAEGDRSYQNQGFYTVKCTRRQPGDYRGLENKYLNQPQLLHTEIFAFISVFFKTLVQLFKSRLRGGADPLLLQGTKPTVNGFRPEA